MNIEDQLFRNAPGKVREEFDRLALKQQIPKGHILTVEGEGCSYFPIVISGSIRVYKVGETEREITLYRIPPGESCILTVSCILSQKKFPALAMMEEAGTVVLVPSGIFRDWIDRFVFWKEYVFELVNYRLVAMLETIEEIAFRRMDSRIAEYLLRWMNPANQTLTTTHKEIANELGTAREVVSRILKDFEHRKIISLSRSKILLLDLDTLKRIS